MTRDELPDLAHADLLALADDDLLEPAGDAQVSRRIDLTEVAGAEPAVDGECVGVQRRIDIADEAVRAARLDLPLGARRTRPTVLIADAHFGGRDRTAFGLAAHARRILGLRGGGGGELGGA